MTGLDKVNAFFGGFEYEEFVPEIYDCTESYYLAYMNNKYTMDSYNLPRREQDLLYPDGLNSKVFNYTEGVSTYFADAWSDCGITSVYSYRWIQLYREMFEIEGVYSWPTSATQTMLNNIILLNDLYNRALEADKAG